MADTTTELEVLDQIVDVLGGTSGQYETVVPTLQQILALLGGGDGSGYNPSLSVGRADALTGSDSTAQWAQRESTGSGAATVRSVQGAAVGWNQLVQLTNRTATSKGITYTAQDGKATFSAPNGAEGQENFYMTIGYNYTPIAGHKYIAHGTSADETVVLSHAYMGTLRNTVFTNQATQAGQFNMRVSADFTGTYECYPQLFDLTAMFGSGNEPSTVAEFEAMYPEAYYPYSAPTLKPVRIAGIASTDAQGGELDSVEWETQTLRAAGSVCDELTAGELVTRVGSRAYQSGDESDSSVVTDMTTTFYPLTTPTTTPISPALPMSYRVQQGGTESIIVPEGEISAAPIITAAEGESAAELVMDALAAIAAPDGPTATANHAQNTYLTMDGKLYKVTSAIAVGETIAPNTNVTETTVMAELIARTA